MKRTGPASPIKNNVSIQKYELRDAIIEQRVLFFGGFPRYMLPSQIKAYFWDEFGSV